MKAMYFLLFMIFSIPGLAEDHYPYFTDQVKQQLFTENKIIIDEHSEMHLSGGEIQEHIIITQNLRV